MKTIPHEHARVPIQAIEPHPRNVNRGNVGRIQERIQQIGYIPRVMVQKSTGFILIGNHTYQAAREEGATELDITYLDVEDQHALQIMLADNREAEFGQRDAEALAELLSELQLQGGLTGSGYDDGDLEKLMGELAPPDFQPTEEEPPRLDEKKKVHCPECGHEFAP